MKFILMILLWGIHITIGIYSFIIMCFHIVNNNTKTSDGLDAMKIFLGNLLLIAYAVLIAYIY